MNAFSDNIHCARTLPPLPIMKVVIANFGNPVNASLDYEAELGDACKTSAHRSSAAVRPAARLGIPHLCARHVSDEPGNCGRSGVLGFRRSNAARKYHSNGILRVMFHNADDVQAYLDRYGYPDLYVNHGSGGQPILDLLENRTFRVHVPALRVGRDR